MERPFSELLAEYLDGTLPAGEAEQFFSQVGENRELLASVIDQRAAMGQSLPENRRRMERMIGRLEAVLNEPVAALNGSAAVLNGAEDRRSATLIGLYRWGLGAAAAILLLAVGVYSWHQLHRQDTTSLPTAQHVVVRPGHSGAILTLSNGKQMVLDSLRNGLVAAQNGANVMMQNGKLAYDPNGEKTTELAYNTMTTPRGRQFQLTLPDGTKVWLNAESSISYPTVFSGGQRLVDVKGEAYFEVARDVRMPFRVRVNGRGEVDVLGTGFNVNAYADEGSMNTTLLEGSVRVMAEGGDGVVIKPGQQAQLRNTVTVADNVDVDKVMAWKNGAFNFEGLGLEAAMRQLEKWYDIKVRYEDGVPDIRFGGKIGRDINLEDLLKILAGTKLKFRIENRRELVIMK